mmetsp:Transcript_38508/g.74714  ORF Transcript_38508/g.74714 Transcript_38508/m.74714 type:complete len:161 (+) Transcript_38508:742-1224(+)
MLQQHFMRLQTPDDQIGGMLFLGLPTVAVHRIDAWSPLAPPTKGKGTHDPRNSYKFPEVLQRAADVDAGDREGMKAKRKPEDNKQPCDPVGKGGDIDVSDEELQKFMTDVKTEIVAIVEGIDPVTSNSTQMVRKHSFRDIRTKEGFIDFYSAAVCVHFVA